MEGCRLILFFDTAFLTTIHSHLIVSLILYYLSTFHFKTFETSSLSADGSKKDCSLLYIDSIKELCPPNPILSALYDENEAVIYKYFYANHNICSISFSSGFSSIN